MECATCGARIDPGDRFCPACRLPNIGGIHHPRFGPPEREQGPMLVERVVGPGLRPCPRCGDGIRASDRFCRSCGIEVSRLAPLPPEGRTVGVWTGKGPEGEGYRPMAVLTAGLRLVLAAVTLAALAVAANSIVVDRDLGATFGASGGAQTDWAMRQNWVNNLTVVQLVLIGLATVVMVAWTRRAYRNLVPLNVIDQRLSPRWAVWGWLIPGVNVIVPKQILDDTWKASDPAVVPFASGPSGWRRTPTPTTHLLWWISTLVALPLVVLVELQLAVGTPLPPSTPAGVHDAQWGYLLLAGSQALLAFAAALLIRMVGSIHERQRDRADAIGPVAPLSAPGAGSGSAAPTDDEPGADPADGPAPPALVHLQRSEAAGRY